MLKNQEAMKLNFDLLFAIFVLKLQHFVLAQLSNRIVLSVDISNSMVFQSRRDKVTLALNTWITYGIPEGIELGIVTFSFQGQVQCAPMQVNSTSRQKLIRCLPQRVLGSSCISCGIRKALQVTTAGSVVVLVTDDDNSKKLGKSLEDLKKLIVDGKVKVVTIVMGRGDMGLEQLSRLSDGLNYNVFDDNGVPGLIAALQASLSLTALALPAACTLLEVELSSSHTLLSESFQVDSSVSSKFCLWISYHPRKMNITGNLTRPDGQKIPLKLDSQNSQLCLLNEMTGLWSVSIHAEEFNKVVAVSVVSGRSCDSSCRMQCWLEKGVLSPSIHASLEMGRHPALMANTSVDIQTPNGSHVVINLWDNGWGSDSQAMDGIYSRFLPPLQQEGQFSVFCRASGQDVHKERFSHISRTQSMQLSVGLRDLPPLPISDLNVTTEGTHVILHFTAPGNHLDWGQAASYELLLASSSLNLQTETPITLQTKPALAGHRDDVTLADFNFTMPSVYIALRAVSTSGLVGPLSNVILVSVPFENGHGETSSLHVQQPYVIIVIVVAAVGFVCVCLVLAYIVNTRRNGHRDVTEKTDRLLGVSFSSARTCD